jgi:hypothetical protein
MTRAIWSSQIQRFLAMAMFACVTWAFTDMTMSMGLRPTQAIATSLLAFAVFTAGILLGGREAGRNYRKYTDYSLVDWALLLIPILLLLKLLPRFLDGGNAVSAEIASWMEQPGRFFDVTLVWSLLLVFFVWDYSVRIAEELAALSFQPGDQLETGTTVPSGPAGPTGSTSATGEAWERSPYRFVSHNKAWRQLMSSFVFGGFFVLVFAGLALVSVDKLGDPARTEVSGVIPSVLLFFVFGLILMSQTSLDRLRAEWLRAGAGIQSGLARRWLTYGLALMGVALLVALLLPTSFTDPASDQLGGAWGALWFVTFPFRYVLGGLFGILGWIFAHLAAILFAPITALVPQGPGDIEGNGLVLRPTPSPLPPAGDAYPSMISRLVWGFLFYALPLAVAAFGVWNTWVKRRVIWNSVRAAWREGSAAIWGIVLDVLAAIWRFLSAVNPRFLDRAPGLIRARLSRRATRRMQGGTPGWLRLRGLGPRALIQYFYVSLLQRAASIGWGRRDGQTAYEYSHDLAEHLPDRRAEVGALTEAYVRAKYSRRPMVEEDARRVRRPWENLRGDLQTRRRASRVAGWFGLNRS